jgi:hypothetical protein
MQAPQEPYRVPRSYRFNRAEILRSLPQQHETFLKDSEEVRRADRCRQCELTGRDPGDRELETCGLTAHSILLFERPEVIGFGGQQDGW